MTEAEGGCCEDIGQVSIDSRVVTALIRFQFEERVRSVSEDDLCELVVDNALPDGDENASSVLEDGSRVSAKTGVSCNDLLHEDVVISHPDCVHGCQGWLFVHSLLACSIQ